ncbi:hypothetical protein GXP67_25025 [Rhodocytophaga rosea]|uniref:Right-handed parallel beta-helix repeat-containing protein n=1 Tax=Rhodocytophaga rosea TaxID=2704465 RepID=A0A6C0GNS2_9BACT|nr:right-handed parallel beta-helix repeat-containing protein [Rhodocytophaga rosea]QHT69676.1 hypothetical protein GXP67_25025 [Rhodocytophaga rosea]
MKTFTLFLLYIAVSISALAQDSYNFYVSPTGNDAASGTSQEMPFESIEKARLAVQALKKEGKFNKPVTVYLREGTYYLEKPLIFTQDDSGTEEIPITYTAYPNEKVTIHGGKAITGWKKYKKDIWIAQVPEAKQGTWSFRQLYVNGTLKQRARIPNQGFLRVKGFPDGGPEVHYHTDCQRFEYANQDINPAWTNLTDVEVIVYHFWTDSHLPIQSINSKNRIVTFKHKAGKVFTNDFTKEGARYIVENVWEGLDTPGEWYLNKKTGLLYYYAQPGENLTKAEVIAPVSPAFIHLEGKPLENKPVAYLTFSNLNFQYTNFELPPGNSNDQQGSASVPAAITMSGAQHCTFDNCRIQNIGTFAFEINPGSRYNRISSCEMSYLAAGGIRINGGNTADHPLLRTGYNQITDNLLHHYGEVFPSAVGLLLMHTHHNEILHNEIHHGWYTGISAGWVWGYKHSISTHNLIAYNHIHHIGGDGLLSDMGGIYTLGVSPGTVLRNNLIHDVNANHYGGWGIYNDEGTTHLLIENNIVYNTKFAPYNIHFCKEVTVRNNIFAFGKLEQISRHRMEPHTSVYFENNIVYWKEGELFSQNWKDKPYTFHVSAINPDQELNSTFEANYNLYYNPSLPADSMKYNGLTFAEWQARGKDTHSKYADPLFVDANNYDFHLKPESPALQLGFQPIDMSRVGVRRKEAEVNKPKD